MICCDTKSPCAMTGAPKKGTINKKKGKKVVEKKKKKFIDDSEDSNSSNDEGDDGADLNDFLVKDGSEDEQSEDGEFDGDKLDMLDKVDVMDVASSEDEDSDETAALAALEDGEDEAEVQEFEKPAVVDKKKVKKKWLKHKPLSIESSSSASMLKKIQVKPVALEDGDEGGEHFDFERDAKQKSSKPDLEDSDEEEEPVVKRKPPQKVIAMDEDDSDEEEVVVKLSAPNATSTLVQFAFSEPDGDAAELPITPPCPLSSQAYLSTPKVSAKKKRKPHTPVASSSQSSVTTSQAGGTHSQPTMSQNSSLGAGGCGSKKVKAAPIKPGVTRLMKGKVEGLVTDKTEGGWIVTFFGNGDVGIMTNAQVKKGVELLGKKTIVQSELSPGGGKPPLPKEANKRKSTDEGGGGGDGGAGVNSEWECGAWI